MLHNTSTRVNFVECWRTRDPQYINEAGYRGAPTREPATAASYPPIAEILSFRYHIWYCAAGSLRVPPPPRPDAAEPALIARYLITTSHGSHTGL